MGPKPFAFVMMPFNQDFDDVYQLGIKPACQDAGYYCQRLDEQVYDGIMLDRIYNQISKADLIVSDVTGKNPNVYYETGYAHALGKRVILVTKNIGDIPFDLNQYHHINYGNGIAILKAELTRRASYFLQHPEAPSSSPLDELRLVVNGTKFDSGANNGAVKSRMSYEGGFIVPVDIGIHLAETSLVSGVSIDVRLITPSTFKVSGFKSVGHEFIYSTVELLDGRIMHKPLMPVEVSVGDPAGVKFELHSNSGDVHAVAGSHQMTLRLISSGFVRDMQLVVTAESRD
jgi:hypothetical protein